MTFFSFFLLANGQALDKKQEAPPVRWAWELFLFLCFLALSTAPLPGQEQSVFHADLFPLAMVKIFSSISLANHQHIVADSLCAQPGSLPIASS